jgi:transcriptional regulator with XRE-family HTH domain
MQDKKRKEIFIGKLIQEKVHESGLSYAEFARRICCTRSNIYRIFECKSIDIERLLLISDVLHYDFIHEIYLPHSDLFASDELIYGLIRVKDGQLFIEELTPDQKMKINTLLST